MLTTSSKCRQASTDELSKVLFALSATLRRTSRRRRVTVGSEGKIHMGLARPRLIARITLAFVGAGMLLATLAVGVANASTTLHFAGDAGSLPAATKKGKGGVYGETVTCGRDADPTSYKVVVKRGGTTIATRTGDDAQGWIRVRPGTYKIITSGRCGSLNASNTTTVKVRYLKDSQTVSKGEFAKIKKGMPAATVNKIIGGKMKSWGKSDGRSYYGKDNTTWCGTSMFTFKKGKLVDKDFQAPLS